MYMPVLKSLSITALPTALRDPVLIRRNKLIERLEEQRKLVVDPKHVRVVERWVDADGQKTLTTKHQRIVPWWRRDGSGHIFMCVKYGNKTLEFEKGKSAIAVPFDEQLPEVIDTLIEAVKAGELDAALAQTSKKLLGSKARRSA
jgi:hypothetical protein